MSQFPMRAALARLLVAGVAVALPCRGQPEERPRNHLAGQTSPYLLAHVHDPVDWYPWGPEALAKARRENKLIFLSVGYATCHWCHVMGRESFQDPQIARVLNEHFVCIKIDREERPDIDLVYMTALQVYQQLAGLAPHAGWPLTMVLTPEGEPFVGGTYFPPRDGDRPGLPGLLPLLEKIHEVWRDQPQRIRDDAAVVARATREALVRQPPPDRRLLNVERVEAALADLAEQFDPKYGGFGYTPDGRQPKFPHPSRLALLAEAVGRRGDAQAQAMLVLTLTKMAEGGLWDHVGGGFFRYCVDRYWNVPHFEKMLADNAQLAAVYARAWEVLRAQAAPAPAAAAPPPKASAAAEASGELLAELETVARQTCEFVLRELTDSQGAFYSALDADAPEGEGAYYRWRRQELRQALSGESWELAVAVLGLDGPPPGGEEGWVVQRGRAWSQIARPRGVSPEALRRQWEPVREQLFLVRGRRPRPATDTKVLAAENGLMIGALAEVGRVFHEERYLEAARRAARTVLACLRTPEGKLLRSYAAGQARGEAFLQDYACLADGLLRLHRATGEATWLTAAAELTRQQIALFADEARGGFFYTSQEHEPLLARGKEMLDGALPAGNAVAAGNLLALAALQNEPQFRALAERTLAAGLAATAEQPGRAAQLALVLWQWSSSAAQRPAAP
jgi:uncharacterized protein YyaL (SSP411 family)